MMEIVNVLTRIFLAPEELNEAITFYEDIFGEKCGPRFEYDGIELTRVGKVLLSAGSEEAIKPYRELMTIFVVDSLNDFKDKLVKYGAVLLKEPETVPTGTNMIVRHPDGSVVEYVELKS
ncbi:MAG: VOC family protein [Actinomycetota bacterium]|jgi:predicted enzyme related to lactoylglutathione lyase|nr:VOC family protein [Actinomycetota bacterium]MCL6093430.1 VOC family protein [Actinomycetota bacterium]MDA8166543.1 VOC family protein [Actinomycetota bacterium]